MLHAHANVPMHIDTSTHTYRHTQTHVHIHVSTSYNCFTQFVSHPLHTYVLLVKTALTVQKSATTRNKDVYQCTVIYMASTLSVPCLHTYRVLVCHSSIQSMICNTGIYTKLHSYSNAWSDLSAMHIQCFITCDLQLVSHLHRIHCLITRKHYKCFRRHQIQICTFKSS